MINDENDGSENSKCRTEKFGFEHVDRHEDDDDHQQYLPRQPVRNLRTCGRTSPQPWLESQHARSQIVYRRTVPH